MNVNFFSVIFLLLCALHIKLLKPRYQHALRRLESYLEYFPLHFHTKAGSGSDPFT